jgi:beta-1,4-mannosyl-glycoprotein beta-1,4-N-acetylglucosaminyltransferase
MKVFDCFQYYDEDLLLEFRLNCLNKYVDNFVIVESCYTHSGEKRKLLFDINKFKSFKKKINYIISDQLPKNLFVIKKEDSFNQVNSKTILNTIAREVLQRNKIFEGIKNANPDDMIIISDLDEIPNLENANFHKIKKKLIFFKQKFYHFRFNLKLDNSDWYGSKACRKKHLSSPQWVRNTKSKKYPFWRLDTLFSNKKYRDIFLVNSGGWHFSNLKSAEGIEKKLRTYGHHREYELNPIGVDGIKDIINNKKAIYNLNTDQRNSKFGMGETLVEEQLSELPKYLNENKEKYSEWLV